MRQQHRRMSQAHKCVLHGERNPQAYRQRIPEAGSSTAFSIDKLDQGQRIEPIHLNDHARSAHGGIHRLHPSRPLDLHRQNARSTQHQLLGLFRDAHTQTGLDFVTSALEFRGFGRAMMMMGVLIDRGLRQLRRGREGGRRSGGRLSRRNRHGVIAQPRHTTTTTPTRRSGSRGGRSRVGTANVVIIAVAVGIDRTGILHQLGEGHE